MAIVRESAAQANGSSTAPTFTKPATLNNADVLVVVFGIRGDTIVNAVPTGWVLLVSALAEDLAGAYGYYKIISDAAGEPATYVWGIAATDQWAGGIVRYSGVNTTTPVDVAGAGNSSNSTAATVGGITTVTADAMVGAFIGIDATTSTTIALTAGDAVAEVWDTTTQIHNEYDDGVKATAGDTTSIQWTLSAARDYAAIEFALRPTTSAQALTMSTLASGAALSVPTLTPGSVSLTMPTIASGAALNAPTLTPGAVAITLPTIASGEQPFVFTLAYVVVLPTIASTEATNAPTLAAGAVSVTLPTIASGATLPAPTLTVGAVSVALPVITNAETLFAPTVAPVVPDQLGLPTIASTAVLAAPTLTPGAIAITMPAIASAEQASAPTLVPGAVALALPTIAAGSAVTAPALSVGTVAIDLPTIASGAALNAPAVMLVGPQAITLPTIASGATLSVPTVGDIPTPVPPVIMVGGVSPSVYSQRIEPARVEQPRPKAQTLALPSIASVATLYAPGVSIDWLQVSQREDEELLLAGVL